MTKKLVMASLLSLGLALGTGSLIACGADKAETHAEGKSCSHDKEACASKDKKTTVSKKEKAAVAEKVAEKKAKADQAAL